jgi:type VI secretion system protein ImpK
MTSVFASNSKAPSLILTPESTEVEQPQPVAVKKSLTDLLYDGFLVLFLLRSGHEPSSAKEFSKKMHQYLTEFERQAKEAGAQLQDVHAAKYAFCAAIDEAILQSNFAIKDDWYLAPLQRMLFGDQLAGTNFFEHLEGLRQDGHHRIQALEVFHLCLLLGFRGKYYFEGEEKLGFLIAKLGDEIARIRSKRAGFSPFWAIPDNVKHSLKREYSLWSLGVLFGVFSLIAYVGIIYALGYETETILASYQGIVNLGPRSAHLTISLP